MNRHRLFGMAVVVLVASSLPAADLLVITPAGQEAPFSPMWVREPQAWMPEAERLAKTGTYELWKLDESDLWILAHQDAGPLGHLRNAEELVKAAQAKGPWLAPSEVPAVLQDVLRNVGTAEEGSALLVSAEEWVIVSGPDGEMEVPLNENLRPGRRSGDAFVGRLFAPGAAATDGSEPQPRAIPRVLKPGLTLTPFGPAGRSSFILQKGISEFNARHDRRMQALVTQIDQISFLKRTRTLPPAGRFSDLPAEFVASLRFFEGGMASMVMDAATRNSLSSAEVTKRFSSATSYRFVRRLCLSHAKPGNVYRRLLKPDLP